MARLFCKGTAWPFGSTLDICLYRKVKLLPARNINTCQPSTTLLLGKINVLHMKKNTCSPHFRNVKPAKTDSEARCFFLLLHWSNSNTLRLMPIFKLLNKKDYNYTRSLVNPFRFLFLHQAGQHPTTFYLSWFQILSKERFSKLPSVFSCVKTDSSLTNWTKTWSQVCSHTTSNCLFCLNDIFCLVEAFVEVVGQNT